MIKKVPHLLFLLALVIISLLFVNQCSESPTSIDEEIEMSYNEVTSFTHSVVTNELNIPWQMAFTPDNRILITERDGLIRVVHEGQISQEPWLDLRDSLRTSAGNTTVENGGLLGIAIDTDFENNGFVYLGYSYEAPLDNTDYNKLVRYREDKITGSVEFDKILVDKVKGLTMHNTGQIKFGPDGKIYWTIGDRHKIESAQDLEDEAGSILRYNTDGTIPDDNPFPDSPIYAYGLRNAQGFDWHPDSGIMLATEHGPSGGTDRYCCNDEVNIILPGKNYGWPVAVGDEVVEGMENPILQSGAGTPLEDYTWAPSGATFVHQGKWRGSFLFAGLRSETLWQVVLNEQNEVVEFNKMLVGEYGRLRSVAQDPEGNIYIITSNTDNFAFGSSGSFDSDYLIKINSEN